MTLADDPVKSAEFPELRAQKHIFRPEGGQLLGSFQHQDDFVQLCRFGEIIEGPPLHGFDCRFNGGIPRQKNDYRFGIVLGEMGQHFHATRLGHHQVGDDDIVAGLRGPGEGFGCARGAVYPIPLLLESLTDELQGCPGIVHQQYSGRQ